MGAKRSARKITSVSVTMTVSTSSADRGRVTAIVAGNTTVSINIPNDHMNALTPLNSHTRRHLFIDDVVWQARGPARGRGRRRQPRGDDAWVGHRDNTRAAGSLP